MIAVCHGLPGDANMSETVNLSDIARALGVSRPTAYQYVRSVGFPQPLAVGSRPDGRRTPPRWNLQDIVAWRAAQTDEHRNIL